jgi:5-formyltetrahydrofolate cyclo-ligase
MRSEKEELRKKYKAIRLAMGREEVVFKSQRICQKLLSEADLSNIKTLSVYKPLDKLNEVDTTLFISQVQTRYPKLKVSLVGSSKNEAIPNQELDLIIVPVLAFDKDNYRLGWGGGWYDRFLADQKPALKIGLCFQNGLIEAGIPLEPHDIPLNKVLTEV